MGKIELVELMHACSAKVTETTKEIYALIPGKGNEEAEIMVVGGIPSSKEEATGLFFTDKPRDVWASFMEKVGLKQSDFYFTYSIKYRPYKINEQTGRMLHIDMTQEEKTIFTPFLWQEIEIIKPRLIITLGTQAYQSLKGLTHTRKAVLGQVETIKGYDLLPLPHPKEKIFTSIVEKEAVSKVLCLNKKETLEEVYQTAMYQEEVDTYELGEREIVLPTRQSHKYAGIKRQKKSSGKKKVMLVYGGNNLPDNPTYEVIERISMVLAELNISVQRIDLYKKNLEMEQFLDELEGADGVILATTVQWYGIGGRMQTFLDQCWEMGRLDPFKGAHLFAVVISLQSYERDALTYITKSWEILGGVEGVNICASIEHSADIETNTLLLEAIDRKTEDFYRILSQQRISLPTSIHDNRILLKIPVKQPLDEGEQMVIQQAIGEEKEEEVIENQVSFMGNYDEFMEQQQQDIQRLTGLFKERLSAQKRTDSKTYPEIFEYKYKPDKTFPDCQISLEITDRPSETFILTFKGATLKARYGQEKDVAVNIRSKAATLDKMIGGKITIQRAFMTGEIKAKGDFTLLYKMDQLFAF